MLIAGLHATPAFLDQFHPACPSRLSPPTSTSQVAPATTPTPTPTRAPDSNVDLNLDSTPQKHHLRIKSTFRFSRCREVSNAIVLYCASEFTSFAISALALLQSAAHISPITSNFCVRLRLLTLQIDQFLTEIGRNKILISHVPSHYLLCHLNEAGPLAAAAPLERPLALAERLVQQASTVRASLSPRHPPVLRPE